MMRFCAFILLSIILSGTAQAHYNTFNDADFGFHMAFPDLWKEQGGLPADGRIKVLAPGGDGASCTIFARQDRRFVIYPREYMLDVVAQEIQWDYWERAISNYDDLYFYYDNYGGLGAGDARYTTVDFIDRTTEPGIRKRALMFATLYADLSMTTLCTAPLETFDTHLDDFKKINDSVQFDARYTPNPRGFYRDFMETKVYDYHWYEPIVMFLWPRKTLAATVHCPLSKDYKACLSKPKPLPIRVR